MAGDDDIRGLKISEKPNPNTLTEAVHDQILGEAEETGDGDEQSRECRLLRRGRVGRDETRDVTGDGGWGMGIANDRIGSKKQKNGGGA